MRSLGNIPKNVRTPIPKKVQTKNPSIKKTMNFNMPSPVYVTKKLSSLVTIKLGNLNLQLKNARPGIFPSRHPHALPYMLPKKTFFFGNNQKKNTGPLSEPVSAHTQPYLASASAIIARASPARNLSASYPADVRPSTTVRSKSTRGA